MSKLNLANNQIKYESIAEIRSREGGVASNRMLSWFGEGLKIFVHTARQTLRVVKCKAVQNIINSNWLL
jgi:hypothetical protein